MDKDVIIRVESLGKKYVLGGGPSSERYTALRDVVANSVKRSVQRLRGKIVSKAPESDGSEFWALRDVNFEVKRGEVVGIIGRNGAGKSTLLKVLSRITEPTKGRIRIKGRVASLLEVGTGFHPELTGRENIFLNGAILGMHRSEIKAKFDEIVAFAEVERFLDTPVKRYSSGMYVRLAFAVAAHLEPEILIVDEVLAVGDAEFQKKCLGKMQDVSREGRTVLFVSHNMAAVSGLTKRAVLLRAGRLAMDDTPDNVIKEYASSASRDAAQKVLVGRGEHTKILRARVVNTAGNEVAFYTPGEFLVLEVTFQTDGSQGLSIEMFLLDERRQRTAWYSLFHYNRISLPTTNGSYRCVFTMQPLWLASGSYSMDITTSVSNSNWDHYIENALDFEVTHSNPGGHSSDFRQGAAGENSSAFRTMSSR